MGKQESREYLSFFKKNANLEHLPMIKSISTECMMWINRSVKKDNNATTEDENKKKVGYNEISTVTEEAVPKKKKKKKEKSYLDDL